MENSLTIWQSFLSYRHVFLSLSLLLFLASCSDDADPEPVNEEEVITTLSLVFTPQGGGQAVEYRFTDLDGDGPNAPVTEVIPAASTLTFGTSYDVSVSFFNESEIPVENVTTEIAAEDDDHLVVFSYPAGLFSTFTYNDTDGTFPVGLSTQCTVGNSGLAQGFLTVILVHEGDKTASGASLGGEVLNASRANTGGETDIEVTFSDITVAP